MMHSLCKFYAPPARVINGSKTAAAVTAISATNARPAARRSAKLIDALVPQALKQSALQPYAEGVGLRATERLVGVSHNSVMNRVKSEIAGKALAKVDASAISFVEADKLWSYVGKKKQFGCGGLLIALPKEFLAERWAIATPQQPGRWVRRFLAALQSLTPPTSTDVTEPSLTKPSTSKARRTRTLSSP